MRFAGAGAGVLLSALLVTAAAVTPAVAATNPVPPGWVSCSVDGFEGSAEFTVERVGARIVTKVSGYQMFGGEKGRDKANIKITERYVVSGALHNVGSKESGNLVQDGASYSLDFGHSVDAKPGYTYWVSLTFIFDTAGPDPTCTTLPFKITVI